eukprot:TRINITY_DN3671_c1_g1_i1.p1 TRINITY_DN3671_c1_g1~~TRINITY_DN3671_c1_g1_i1.p1  ORF type:complete len:801 (+),score=96.35 TRINITY_DN3671_c1_g1_i1:120-2405(+)
MAPLKLLEKDVNTVTLQWGAGLTGQQQGPSHVEVRCRRYGETWMNVDPRSNQLVPLGTGSVCKGSTGTIIVGGLEENADYEFTCCERGSNGGTGPYSDPLAIKTSSKPNQVSKIHVSEITDDAALITWENPNGLFDLMLKLRKKTVNDEGDWLNIDSKTCQAVQNGQGKAPSADTRKQSITELDPNTEYELISRGGNDVGWGPSTEPITFTTQLRSVGKAIKLTCDSTNRTNATLSWEQPNQEAFCVAIRGRKKDQEWMTFDRSKNRLLPSSESSIPTSQTTATIKRLEEGTIYEFSGRVLYREGWSQWADSITVTTLIGMQPVTIGKITCCTAHFEWEVPDVAVNIAIRCRKVGSDKWQHVNTRTNTLVPLGEGIAPRASDHAIVLRGLEEKTKYETAACARTASGWGSYSQKTIFETPPANCEVLKCLEATASSVTLKLNVPSFKDGRDKVSIRCKKEGDNPWMDVDASKGKLVTRGNGTALSEGIVYVEGLEEGATYEMETSRDAKGVPSTPLSILLGKPYVYREPPATSCACFRRCRAALISKLSEKPILLEHLNDLGDKCFCSGCHTDYAVYKRGTTDYILPLGWCRVGVKTHKPPALEQLAFKKWNPCYHGTSPDHLIDVLCCGQLLKPGSSTPKGGKLHVREGHIQKVFKRTNAHTGHREDFDPSQVFFSPSIRYCSYGRAYMTEFSFAGHKYRFALQVRIQPDTYTIGQETVGAMRKGDTIDPYVPNTAIEWYTGELHTHMITGVLVNERVDK